MKNKGELHNENFNEREIIEYILDKDSFFEYKKEYAKNIITRRGKINNVSI